MEQEQSEGLSATQGDHHWPWRSSNNNSNSLLTGLGNSNSIATTPRNPLFLDRQYKRKRRCRRRSRTAIATASSSAPSFRRRAYRSCYYYWCYSLFCWCLALSATPTTSTTMTAFFLLLLSPSLVVRAEDVSYNNNANNIEEEPEVNYPASHGMVAVGRSCSKTAIVVTSARLTCDSPGAYYYGSKTYRNSEVCVEGDKVNLRLHVKINEALDSSSSVYLQMDVGLYNTFKTIVSPTNLCQLPISSTDGNGQACPQAGDYLLKTAFYLPTLLDDDNKEFHFTPDLNITFTDGKHNRLGCARTGTAAMHRDAKRRRIFGMWTLGMALVVFGAVFGGLLVLAHRRRKRLEKLSEKKVQKYQYFRTLPNGQVIPIQQGMPIPPHIIPPVPPPPPPPPSSPYSMSTPGGGLGPPPPPHEAYQISNPAYNETQLPTRPVI